MKSREIRVKKKKKRNSSMYGAITQYPIFVLSESQKERKKERKWRKKLI